MPNKNVSTEGPKATTAAKPAKKSAASKKLSGKALAEVEFAARLANPLSAATMLGRPTPAQLSC
jgi:hypothetical protein